MTKLLRRTSCSLLVGLLLTGNGLAWSEPLNYHVQNAHVSEGVDVDIFIPDSKAPSSGRPALLMIPGGGWSTSDKQAMHPLCDAFARLGFVTVTTTYRHAPQFNWPAQQQDVVQVVWQLREHAKDLGIDPRRIGAIGASAGALLAGHLGSIDQKSPRSQVSSKVQRVITAGGPWNLAHAVSTFKAYQWQPNPIYPDISALGMISNLFGAIPTEAQAATASPYYAVKADSAPTLFLHGSADTLVPPLQSIETCKHMREQGARCEIRIFDEVGHTITPAFVQPMMQFLQDWIPASP